MFFFFSPALIYLNFPGAKETKDRWPDALPQHQKRMPQTELRRARFITRTLLQSLPGRRRYR